MFGHVGSKVALALFLAAMAVPGCDDDDSPKTTFEVQHFVGVEGECTNGGIRVDILEDNAVKLDKRQYICNGRNGTAGKDGRDGKDGGGLSTLMVTSNDVGSSCANGGVRIDTGADANGNGALDSNEVTNSRYICNGTNGSDGSSASIQTSAFSGAKGKCTDGGIQIDILIDGAVDSSQTQYVCNGSGGQSGPICAADTEIVCDAARPTIRKKCNADGSGWIEEDCSAGIPAHAIASCSVEACGWSCEDGYDKVGDACEESSSGCQAGTKRCKDSKVEVCNEAGDGWTVDQDCTAETIPDNASATCSNNTCGWACNSGYSEDNGQCIQQQSTTCAADIDCKGTDTPTCDANASKNCIALDHYESFEGITSTKPNEYTSGEWESTNTGITVNYSNVMMNTKSGETDFAIDGAGLVFKKATGSISFTVTDGVGRIDFEMKKAFSGSGERGTQISANNTTLSCTGLDNFDDDEIHHVTCDNVNLSGSVSIKIETTTTKQVVIDNVSWSDHS